MPPHGDEVIDNVTPPVANTLGASTTATSTSTLMLGGAGVMEKLEGAGNFLSWKFTMKMMLTLEGLWDLIVRLDDTPLTGSDVVRDQRALARLCLGLKPGLYQYVRDAKSAKDAWKKLSHVFEDRGLYRRVLLLRQLHRIEFSHFSSMSSYIEKVMSLVHQLSDIEKTVEDEEIAEILLSGLPPEYDSLVSNLETLCLTSKLSSEVVRTRLLQEEQRKDSMNTSSTSTTSAFVSKKQITCKYCGKPGHVKAKCFKLRREKMAKKRDNKDQHASAYLAHAAAAELFLDSGSSNHLVKDKELLCNLKDTSAQSISTANKQQMTSTSAGELNLVMNNKGDAYDKCEACLKGKMATKPFPKASSSRTTQPLQLIHSDVCGPLPEASWGGARYLVTFTDDFTRKTFGYLMKNKSQVMSHFVQFKALVEKQLNLPIKCLRSDNDGVYCTGSEDESEPAGLSASEDELDPAGLPAREPSSEPLTSPCETTARDGAATGPVTVASHTGRPIRSTRNVQPPRFSDYDMTDNSFMVFENPFISEPLTYNEAVNSAHSKEWLEAMTREYDALVANNVWELVDRPVDKNIVKCKWFLKKNLM
ncbi:uncharacterized protein LOC134660703 [Cydia amplana]|uniref:uncharacterized protein LOC134660703 n=1 Tax=Cydia amplana TaxID=1869771 RepID=UPI002FE5BF8F